MRDSATVDVFLIEDDPADIYLIQRAVMDCIPQAMVWLASNGSQALAFLRHEPPFTKSPSPRLILLDLGIPGSDGHVVLTELRTLVPYATTPVIVISGRERTVEEARCLALGANAYVQKSTDFHTYFGSVQAIMREWLGRLSTLGLPGKDLQPARTAHSVSH
jgi:CheY-like chemotaxis protein